MLPRSPISLKLVTFSKPDKLTLGRPEARTSVICPTDGNTKQDRKTKYKSIN